jgi:hypothetical protein
MFLRAHIPEGEKRNALMLKVGDAVLYLYGDTLIGLQTPEGTWRLNTVSMTVAKAETIKRKQVFFNLRAGWITALQSNELEEKAGKTWLKEYAMYARERMQGGPA